MSGAPASAWSIRHLGADDAALLEQVCTFFGEVFDDTETYTAQRPSREYLRRLLARDTFIALAALHEGRVIGALAAYELPKFEQQRSEVYIYDLGVDPAFRRQGIATALIEALKPIAAARGAWVIFVQADTAPEDAPARALYDKLGVREQVLHFDIPVR